KTAEGTNGMSEESEGCRSDHARSAMRSPVSGVQRRTARQFLRWAGAALGLAATTEIAVAGSFTRGCAARDLQLLMLIEHHENTEAVPARHLPAAVLSLLDARILFHPGDVSVGFAVFYGIAEGDTV